MKLLYSLILTLFFSVGMAQLTVTPTFDDIYIPMSDGDSLQADVYIPSTVTTGEVILIQTPYNKNWFSFSLPMGVGTDLDSQPFIFVIVDWRGFYGSSMADVSSVDRGQDGYDVCDWIVAQPWHGDRIGTWGPSALGSIQYRLIAKDHPNHTCAVPMVNTGHQSYESYFYGGVMEEARLFQLDALGYGLSPLVLGNHYDAPLWTFSSTNTWFADDIRIPTLQVGGWYDHAIDEMMSFYTASRSEADISVQDQQWLVVGPWVHGGTGSAYVGSADQGELMYPEAEFKSDSMAWDFFNYYLLDDPNGWETTDLITYYDMGGDEHWLTTNDDNIAITSTESLYLNGLGRLTSFTGLDSSSFLSDPSNPSPTIGGATLSDGLDQGPYDQNTLDARTDILTFETQTLTEDVAIIGRVLLELFVSADVSDCDIAVRLTDVYPDGRSMLITDGIQRMRFRGGDYTASGEEFMVPGEIYPVTVAMPFVAYTWKTGHKIKVYISGNHDTRFNVNEQTGGPMYATETPQSGTIAIHHSPTYASKIILPTSANFLGNESIENNVGFSLYPNPAKDILQISGNAPNSYTIYGIDGRLLLKGKYSSNGIEVSTLSSGQYILVGEYKNGSRAHKKFIVH